MPNITGNALLYRTVQRITVTNTSTVTPALTGTVVLLHASTDCFVLAGPADLADPTVTDSTGIPLIAGEKFHMNIQQGWKIAVIRNTTDGYLYVSIGR